MFMKRILVAGAAGAFLAAGVVAASAADLPAPPPVAPAPPPPVAMAPGFDWGGPYIGAYGGAIFNAPFDPIYEIGLQAGFNMARGAFLAGLEGYAEYRFSTGFGNHWSAGANARLGAVLGERVLLYGEAGVGYVFTGGGFPVWSAGGGIELGLAQAVSLFTEVKAIAPFGAGPGALGVQVQAGLNFHPGN